MPEEPTLVRTLVQMYLAGHLTKAELYEGCMALHKDALLVMEFIEDDADGKLPFGSLTEYLEQWLERS